MSGFAKDWHMGKMLGVPKKEDKIAADKDKERDKAQKEEGMVVDILNRARQHFISRGITGNIQIQYALGIAIQTGNSISCDVTEEDVSGGEIGGDDEGTLQKSEGDQPMPPESDSPDEHLSYTAKLAIKSMARLFEKMEWGSEPYAAVSYKPNLEICRTVAFNAQVLQLSISFTAPVEDVLKWREVRLARQHAQEQEQQAAPTK